MDFEVFCEKIWGNACEQRRLWAGSGEVLFFEGDVFHGEGAATEVVQDAGIRGQVEGELVGVQRLAGLAVR